MPLLFKYHPSSQSQIALWQVKESSSELRDKLVVKDEFDGQLASISLESRKAEKLAVRLLLQQLLGFEQSKLFYNSFGRPMLKAPEKIAISHSKGMVGVFLHKKVPVGLDIEHLRGLALRLYSKFGSDKEKAIIDQLDDMAEKEWMACLLWSAKETLYKWYGRKKVSFKENLLVDLPKAMKPNGRIDCRLRIKNFDESVALYYLRFGNNILTYCAHEAQEL